MIPSYKARFVGLVKIIITLLVFFLCPSANASVRPYIEPLEAIENTHKIEDISIVTTDSNVMYHLQNLAQDVAIAQKLQVHVSLFDESRVTRSLQLGKKGDVLITSDAKLCENLVLKGIASPLGLKKILQEHIYCIGIGDDGRILMLMPEKYPSHTQERIGEMALLLNASIYVFSKDEDAHKKMAEWLKFGMPICGFSSTFISLNVESVLLHKTDAKVEYFACPLIGLKKDGYDILMQYYETQHNS